MCASLTGYPFLVNDKAMHVRPTLYNNKMDHEKTCIYMNRIYEYYRFSFIAS